MKKLFFIAWAMLCCLFASAQQYKQITDVPYHLDGDAYAQSRCKLDFYYPTDSVGFPVVVWFHGGGLIEGERFTPEQLKEKGVGVIAVNYRFMPKCTINDCYDDAAAAVAWAFKNVEKYGGSNKRIFLAGHSAGATLVDMVVLDKKYLQKYDIDADRVAGVFPFSGQVVDHYNYRHHFKNLKPLTPTIDENSPIYHTRKLAQPMIILSGDRELELYGRYEETAWFWRLMKLAGNEHVYLYEFDGYDHGGMPAPAYPVMLRYIKAICNGEPLTR